MQEDGQPDASHVVVVNELEQYSIWIAGKALPGGWRAEGFNGSLEDCTDHIDAVWTDMRPLNLRQAMAKA